MVTRLAPGSIIDLAIAVVLAIVAQVQFWTGTIYGLAAVQAVLLLAATLPLAWRRKAPVLVAGVISGALGLQAALVKPSDAVGAFLALLLAVFSVAAYGRARRSVLVLGLAVAAIVYHLHRDPGSRNPFFQVIELAVVGLVMIAGFAVSNRERRLSAVVRSAADQEARRGAELERALGEQRLQIAREMHDLIAHGVTVMVLQAGAARHALGRDPEQSRRSLRLVEDTGRETLAELRRLLGVLRAGGEAATAVTPQPSLSQLDDLLANARSAGLDVAASVEIGQRHIPPGVDLAAYRIVQEALTNAMKHGGLAPVEVWVALAGDCLDISVTDNGTAGGPVDGPAGHGIAGLRERVAAYGGRLEAGHRAGGGFEVRASLPVSDGPA